MKNYVMGKNNEKYQIFYFHSSSPIKMSSTAEVKIMLPSNAHLRMFNDNWMESIIVEQKGDHSVISVRGNEAENALYNAVKWVESQSGILSENEWNWEEVTEEEKHRYFGDQLEKIMLVTWKD